RTRGTMTISFGRALPLMAVGVLMAGCTGADRTPSPAAVESRRIPVDTVVDKIRGGMLGQLLGNLNGLKHEMQYITEPGNVEEYVPALPDGARTDDDTDFEWVYVVEMQRRR